MSTIEEKAQQILNEKKIKILPENLKKDITAFGVTGTLEANTNIKLFKTREEMQNDSTAKINDIAVVYGMHLKGIDPKTYVDKWYIPEIITFPRAVTEDIAFDFCYGSGGGCPSLTPTEFALYCQAGGQMFDCRYTSTDAITYKRTEVHMEDMTNGDWVSIYWDAETNILYNVSKYNEHFYYEIYNKEKAEEYADIFHIIFREPEFIFDYIYKYSGVQNNQLVTAINDIKINTNNTNDPYKWELSCNYLYDKKSYDTIQTALIAVRKDIGLSDGYTYPALIEYLSDTNYRLYTFKYGNDNIWYSPATFLSRLNVDNTDNKIYIGACCSDYTTFELLVYDVDVSDPINPKVTNRKNDITINNCTYESSTNKALYTLPVSEHNYFTMRNSYNNTKYINGVIVPSENNVYEYYDGLRMEYEIGKDLIYIPAETQLTLDNNNQLLPGKTALGVDGVYEGDSSIYKNLDSNTIMQDILGLPESNELNFIEGASKNNIEYYKYDEEGKSCIISSNLRNLYNIDLDCTDTYKVSYGSFSYLNKAQTTYCYENKDRNLCIKDLVSGTTIIKKVSASSNSSYPAIRMSPNEIIYYIGADLFVHLYDINSGEDITTTIAVTSGHYGLNDLLADEKYIIIQINYSGSATSKIYALNSTTYELIATLSNVGYYYGCFKTQLGNYYIQTQNSYNFYQFTGTKFKLLKSGQAYGHLETSSYLFGYYRGDYWDNTCLRSNKTSGSYTKITMNVTSDCKLSAYWLKVTDQYVWVTGKINDELYIVKCTWEINNDIPTLTQVYKYKVPYNIMWIFEDNKCSEGNIIPYYHYIKECDDKGLVFNDCRRGTNNWDYINSYEFKRISKSDYKNYDFAGIRDSNDVLYSWDDTSHVSQFYKIHI